MNIYKISQSVHNGYDTYDAAIVAAETSQEAQVIHPGRRQIWSPKHNQWVDPSYPDDPYDYRDWAPIDAVTVQLLAENVPNLQPGVILASFNAG